MLVIENDGEDDGGKNNKRDNAGPPRRGVKQVEVVVAAHFSE